MIYRIIEFLREGAVFHVIFKEVVTLKSSKIIFLKHFFFLFYFIGCTVFKQIMDIYRFVSN